jgi:hypothetical protein
MALGKLFDMVGDVILPNEHCKIIMPIKNCLDKYFKQYPKILPFLHYMCSLNKEDNPYADVDLEMRQEQIIYDLHLGEIDFEDPIIRKALICVEEKYSTTFYKMYKGLKVMCDKIGDKLASTEIDLDKDGNSTAILKLMGDYEKYRKSFKQAYKDFEEEQSQVNVRGGGKLAFDEDEDYS